jgi:chemotaxis protein CheD
MSSAFTTGSTIGEVIDVEMGEVRVSSCLTNTLLGYGLGACVGLCIYDPFLRIAGLAHIVLPERQNFNASGKDRSAVAPGKFADTAIPFLIEEIRHSGGELKNLRATIVGGAHIFSQGADNGGPVSRLEIGQRNANAVTEALNKHSITIVATDVGGCHGRTVSLRVCDGAVAVRPIGSEEAILAVLGREREVVGLTR